MNLDRYRAAAPEGVVVYDDSHAFIAEKPSRRSTGFKVEGDLAGWDVADGFQLSEGDMWLSHSKWRISVHDGEIYAVLRKVPGASTYTFDGPVWLIGTVPDGVPSDVASVPLRALLDPIEGQRSMRDSLLWAVDEIRTGLARLAAETQQVGV